MDNEIVSAGVFQKTSSVKNTLEVRQGFQSYLHALKAKSIAMFPCYQFHGR